MKYQILLVKMEKPEIFIGLLLEGIDYGIENKLIYDTYLKITDDYFPDKTYNIIPYRVNFNPKDRIDVPKYILLTGDISDNEDLEVIRLLVVDYIDEVSLPENFYRVTKDEFSNIVRSYTTEINNPDFEDIRNDNKILSSLRMIKADKYKATCHII